MSYNGQVALLVCSFIAVALAALQPFMQSGLRVAERRPMPWWTAFIAVVLLFSAALSLRSTWRGQDQIMSAICSSAVMIGGAFATWILETLLRKPFALREADFMRSLLLAPLVVLMCGDHVFAARWVSDAFLLWFVCGFLSQVFVSTLTRWLTPKRHIVRRKEP